MDNKLLLLSFGLFFLLSVNLVSADFLIYVQPANQGIVRLNVTPFQTAIEQRSFEIRNLNNFSVTIDLEPNANLTKIIDIEKTFALQTNESRIINYTIKVSEPGFYDGSIQLSFTGESSTVTYETKLTVIASKSEMDYKIFIIPAIVLIVIAAVVLIYKKRWKIVAEKRKVRK